MSLAEIEQLQKWDLVREPANDDFIILPDLGGPTDVESKHSMPAFQDDSKTYIFVLDTFKYRSSVETAHWISAFRDSRKSALSKQQTTYGFTLPYELRYLRNIVEKSRWMLDLQDDWDDEGSPAYSESTWRRAVTFLLKNALALWQEQQVLITKPAIHNGPEGSIDIHWGSDNRKLLINIPTNTDEPTNFYGYDLTGIEIRGTLNLSDSNKWLLLWQME
jgi:hypothetical protein